MDSAFIFLTHKYSDPILNEYRKINLASKDLGDTWLLFQGQTIPENIPTQDLKVHLTSDQDLNQLDFASYDGNVLPGNAHFPLLHFFHSHRTYQNYWIIEYDVRFTGNWRRLFKRFQTDPTDFIASHIRAYQDEPGWSHWALQHPHKNIPLDQRIKSYNVIFRLSRAALRCIDSAHQEGWKGHNEVLIPTLLKHHGYSYTDFGGEGPFVPPTRINKHYIGKYTLRYRPPHTRSKYYPNKIYHPIKHSSTAFWTTSLTSILHQLSVKYQYGLLRLRKGPLT